MSVTRITPLSLSSAALTPSRVTSTSRSACWRYFQSPIPSRLERAPSSRKLPGMRASSRVFCGSTTASDRDSPTANVVVVAASSPAIHASRSPRLCRFVITPGSSAAVSDRDRTSTSVSPVARSSSTPACDGSSTTGSRAASANCSPASSAASLTVVRNGFASACPWMSRTPASTSIV
jgi:hypothetical protein